MKKGNGGSRRRRRIKRTYFIRNTHGSGGHLEAGMRNLVGIFRAADLFTVQERGKPFSQGGGLGGSRIDFKNYAEMTESYYTLLFLLYI